MSILGTNVIVGSGGGYTDAEAIAAVEGEATLVLASGLTVDGDAINSQGTFTPTIMDDSLDGSGEGQTYSVQIGRFTQNGNRIHFSIDIRITSLGTLTTSEGTKVGGLPFTSNSASNAINSVCVGNASNLAISADQALTGRVTNNVAYVIVHLWDRTTGAGNLSLAELSADGILQISGTYEV